MVPISRESQRNPESAKPVLLSLMGVALALLAIGVVRGTFVRHLIQVMPIAVAIGVVARRPDWGAYAAVPLFVFWSLGLLGIADEQYTPIQRALMVTIAGLSVFGVMRSVALGRPLRVVQRVVTAAAFAAMQFAAGWISFLWANAVIASVQRSRLGL
jgi:hypothetical protein